MNCWICPQDIRRCGRPTPCSVFLRVAILSCMAPQYSSRLRRIRPKVRNEIRRYRLQLGITQRELARRVGVRLSTLSSWERGVTWPTKQLLLDLAIGLSTTVEGLFPEQFFERKRQRTISAEGA